jgi:hypothetical protein
MRHGGWPMAGGIRYLQRETWKGPTMIGFRMERTNSLDVRGFGRCLRPFLGALLAAALPAAAATTTTTLAVTSGGSAATSVASGSAVTLTATVLAGAVPVTVGQVNFCDATASSCADIHLLATAQLTSAGTASWKYIPGIGSHSYKAVFVGTKSDSTSDSAVSLLSVAGKYPTSTALVSSGSVGAYSLGATVVAGGSATISGSISFLDLSNASATLGTEALTSNPSGPGFFPVWSSPAGVSYGTNDAVVGDFNGDGIPDLAVLEEYFGDYDQPDSEVVIFLGDGDGTFTAVPGSPATIIDGNYGSLNISSMVVEDFNGDGKADLFVTRNSTVLLGNGDGTFTPGPTVPLMITNPTYITDGDFNGDGFADLIVASYISETPDSYMLTEFLGNGDGSFAVGPAISVALSGPVAIAPGDLNGDGISDLAVTNYGGTVSVLLGNGDGSFTASPISPVVTAPISIAEADFNGDGIPDLAVGISGNSAPVMGTTIMIFLGSGNGLFTVGTPIQGSSNPAAIAVEDFNGDGKADLLVASNTSLGLLLGSGDGTFTASPATGSLYAPTFVAAADFNGDGIPDAVAESEFQSVVGAGATVWAGAMQSATATLNGVSVPPGTGAHQVAANYPGDGNYIASTSSALSLSASIATPTINLTSAPNPATYGAALVFIATVSGSGLQPTGTVNFRSNVGQLGTATLNSSGVATYTISTLPLGSYSIAASYSGDSNYNAVTSASESVTVSKGTATASVTSSAASGVVGSPLTFTATVSGGGAAPTGSVSFLDGTTSLGSGTLAAGTASLTTSSLAVGSHSITVSYAGDTNYSPVTSTPVSITVTLVPATVALSPASASFYAGLAQPVTISVSGVSGKPTPTGTITLSNGAGYTSAATALSAGSAAITIPVNSLANGSNTITAAYSGDTNYGAANGTATYVVSTTAPGFTISGTAVTVSPGAGSGNTSMVNVTPVAISGFTGSVTLSAAITSSPSGATAAPTLSFGSTSPVSVSGTTAATATLTIATTASTTSALKYPGGDNLRWAEAGGGVLACVLLFGIPARRRGWRTMAGGLLLAIASVGGMAGCGGGGGGGSVTNPGTTAGAYQITVTGASGSITETTVVNLTVQ